MSVKVLIKGCEYRIPEEAIKNALCNCGELTTEIVEERFKDPHDPEGANSKNCSLNVTFFGTKSLT